MKRKTYLAIVAAVVISLLLGIFGCAQAPEAEERPEVTRLLVGATSATSGTYVLQAAMIASINRAPGIQATLIEAGGTSGSTEMLRKGLIDATLSMNQRVAYNAYNQTGPYADKGSFKDLRIWVLKARMALHILVREDSGVQTLEDLQGKPFSFGLPGSSTAKYIQQSFDALGIKVEEFVGSYGDATAAIKDRRIVGVAKAGMGRGFDSSQIELAATTKLRAVGVTEEQKAKIRAVDMTASFVNIPANTIKQLPGHPTLSAFSTVSGAAATPEVPQSIIYETVKALHENWEDVVVKAYSGAASVDIGSADTLEAFGELEGSAPLHAGAVQYFMELGLDIPDFLIPPEFKK
ncbi:TAXI family TRAP transporter solute-binding subunit [Chloroflexota bacterium]